jgi:hypothetical protein
MIETNAADEPGHAEIIERISRQVTTCFDGLAEAMVAGQNELRREIGRMQKSFVILETTMTTREDASRQARGEMREALESRVEGAVRGAMDELRHETGVLHKRIDRVERRSGRPLGGAPAPAGANGGDALDGIARSVWAAVRAWLAATIWGRIIATLLALAAALGGGMVIGSSTAAPAAGAAPASDSPPQGHPAGAVRVAIPPPPAPRDASALGLRPDHG